MKRVLCATCLALACAVALSAQAQQGADDQKKATPAAKQADSSVTMTGCLRAGDTPNSFVLATAKTAEAPAAAAPANPPVEPPANPPANPANPPAQPPANPANPPAQPVIPGNPPSTPTTPPTAANPPAIPDAAAPVGTSGAPEAGADTIRLIGEPAGMKLQDHVGHTVKVTGSLTAAAAKGRATGRSLNVSKIEHVSDTCK